MFLETDVGGMEVGLGSKKQVRGAGKGQGTGWVDRMDGQDQLLSREDKWGFPQCFLPRCQTRVVKSQNKC